MYLLFRPISDIFSIRTSYVSEKVKQWRHLGGARECSCTHENLSRGGGQRYHFAPTDSSQKYYTN